MNNESSQILEFTKYQREHQGLGVVELKLKLQQDQRISAFEDCKRLDLKQFEVHWNWWASVQLSAIQEFYVW